MNVIEAAKRLNKSPDFIRAGLQHGRLPFGTAVKTSSKWSYYISEQAFEKYLKEGIVYEKVIKLLETYFDTENSKVKVAGELKNFNLSQIIDGNLDPIIDALITKDRAEKLNENSSI